MPETERLPAREVRSHGGTFGGAHACVLFVLLAAACSRAEGPERALHQLEGLSFVPAGRCRILELYVDHANCTINEPILVDRYEVTRATWQAYFPERVLGAGAFDGHPLARIDDATLYWPAFLDYAEAVELAERRGLRLLTAQEWIHIAVARTGLRYPWGYAQDSLANTAELHNEAPTPVGTFENGRSRFFGCYDLVGNVWEWVDGRTQGYTTDPTVLDAVNEVEGDAYATIFGGSFRSSLQPTFRALRDKDGYVYLRFHCRTKDKRTESPDIGVRHAVDARTYLRRQAALWGGAERAEARVRAVGKRWREESGLESVTPFLEGLAAEEGVPPALRWLAQGVEPRGGAR